jgi:hypothetical protein
MPPVFYADHGSCAARTLTRVALWLVLQAIMGSPLGIVRLMDMVAEREVIRNEALLLLIVLTRSSQDIQKIVAFEGGFERLFAIIRCDTLAEHARAPRLSACTLRPFCRHHPPQPRTRCACVWPDVQWMSTALRVATTVAACPLCWLLF